MNEEKNTEFIDLSKIIKTLIARRRLFYVVLPITAVLAYLLILCIPRTYSTRVKLAPELDNSASEGAVSSLASSFGFDIGSMVTTDAISPELYPELLESNDFVVTLFPITVENEDGTIKASYYDYLTKYQKRPWWAYTIGWIKKILPKPKDDSKGKKGEINPLRLTKKQHDVADAIHSKIKCSIDRKTSLITINVTDQDRLICATVADSVRKRLQTFITNYRTNKARIDVDYYRKLTAEAKQDYERIRQTYANYSDSNIDVILPSYQAKREDLENDMQLKYNNYTTYNTQLQAALAKLQQRTPAFTLLEGASVPVKPSGPKRMMFVAFILILTFFGLLIKVLKDETTTKTIKDA